MQKQSLVFKLRINVNLKKIKKFSEKQIKFYKKYSLIAFQALKEPKFQKFIHKIFKKENIKQNKIKDVQVKLFPIKNENGKFLAGKYTKKGIVFIYPKRMGYFQNLINEEGKEKARLFLKSRARAALIHEILHAKYSSEEQRVRKLTFKYFKDFFNFLNPNLKANKILVRLFPKAFEKI